MAEDVITKLLDDHQQVKHLFARFDSAARTEWEGLFCELTNDLVRHEVAEEEILYPEVRKVLPGGEAIADERIKEQSEAEELLADMEKDGLEDSRFPVRLNQLRDAVLAHAEKEELTVFTPFREAVGPGRREELAGRYEKAKAAAPTHPHPHAPDTPPGNVVLGPIAALVDRARDAIHKAAS